MNDTGIWQKYPYVDGSPYDSWRDWQCMYDSCICKATSYIDPPDAPGVHLGNRVFVTNIKSQEKSAYTLTSGPNDPEKGLLFFGSPLGKAVHWKEVGEVVQAGNTDYLIEKIERLI